MSSSEFISVKTPSFSDFSLPKKVLDNIDHLGDFASKKGSSLFKGIDLVLEWIGKVTFLLPQTLSTLKLAEKGLQESGSIETLISVAALLPESEKGLSSLKNKVTAWSKVELPPLKTEKIAKKAFFKYLLPSIKKIDSFFWALSHFKPMNGQGMNIYHGLGYGVGSILSAKDLYSSGVELHKMKKSEKWKLTGVKVAKFMSNLGGAILGLALLLISSTKLSCAYLGFTSTSLALTLSEYVMNHNVDSLEKQRKALEKNLKRESSFQMIV